MLLVDNLGFQDISTILILVVVSGECSLTGYHVQCRNRAGYCRSGFRFNNYELVFSSYIANLLNAFDACGEDTPLNLSTKVWLEQHVDGL